MKNVVRALTLALAVTGMTAAAHVPSHTGHILVGKVATVPTPVCGPNDPNTCGIGSGK